MDYRLDIVLQIQKIDYNIVVQIKELTYSTQERYRIDLKIASNNYKPVKVLSYVVLFNYVTLIKTTKTCSIRQRSKKRRQICHKRNSAGNDPFVTII